MVHAALVALVLFCIGQALEIFSPRFPQGSREQMVLVVNPATTAADQLNPLLRDGWRVTHVTTSMSAVSPNPNLDKWFANTVYVLER